MQYILLSCITCILNFMAKDPKSCLVQGHPDKEAKIMALSPADSKFNVSLTTAELWRQRYELSWPTSLDTWNYSTPSGSRVRVPGLSPSFGLVPVAFTSLGSAALPRGTRLVFLSNIGFLNIRWNGRVLQKKKKNELPYAKRNTIHSIEEMRLRGCLTRPKGDSYLGQFPGSTVWPLPSWVHKFLLSKPWTWLDPEHWLILTMLTETFIKFAAKSANSQWGNSPSSGWMLMSAWPAVDRLHGEPRDQQALQWA